jgi:hypothetical protein
MNAYFVEKKLICAEEIQKQMSTDIHRWRFG